MTTPGGWSHRFGTGAEPPPLPPSAAGRFHYDGAFIGPLRPPAPPEPPPVLGPDGLPLPPVTQDVLALPLGT
ncbi:MAG: hypothetical protein WCK58_14785, partial [Chloroflexota bacterium]